MSPPRISETPWPMIVKFCMRNLLIIWKISTEKNFGKSKKKKKFPEIFSEIFSKFFQKFSKFFLWFKFFGFQNFSKIFSKIFQNCFFGSNFSEIFILAKFSAIENNFSFRNLFRGFGKLLTIDDFFAMLLTLWLPWNSTLWQCRRAKQIDVEALQPKNSLLRFRFKRRSWNCLPS